MPGMAWNWIKFSNCKLSEFVSSSVGAVSHEPGTGNRPRFALASKFILWLEWQLEVVLCHTLRCVILYTWRLTLQLTTG